MTIPRIDVPPDAERTPEQHAAIAEAVSGPRARVPAPMRAWIASPELARRAQHLGAFLRYGTALTPRQSELAILVTARHWDCAFEWFAHEREALKAGLPAAICDALAEGRDPEGFDAQEALVYAVARTIHGQGFVDDALYAEAVEGLGETAVVDLVGLLGYYTMVAMTLNVFRILPPDDAPARLTPRG